MPVVAITGGVGSGKSTAAGYFRDLGAVVFFLFFFNHTATPDIYTLSLHDALPISRDERHAPAGLPLPGGALSLAARRPLLRVLAGVLPAGSFPRVAGPGFAGPLSPAEALVEIGRAHV